MKGGGGKAVIGEDATESFMEQMGLICNRGIYREGRKGRGSRGVHEAQKGLCPINVLAVVVVLRQGDCHETKHVCTSPKFVT